MKISFFEYQTSLKSAVDHATGSTFDWTPITRETWKRWFEDAAWVEDILAERIQATSLPPKAREPPGNALYWLVGGAVTLAIGGLIIVCAVFDKPARIEAEFDFSDFLE